MGTGITPRWQLKDPALKESIQALWADWVKEADWDGVCDFYGLQSLVTRSLIEAGDVLVRSFTIPHIPHDDVILPQEYEGIRAFGTENEFAGYARVVNDHQQTMRNKHAITLEHLRMGALISRRLSL